MNASFERFVTDIMAQRPMVERSSIADARVVRGEEAIRMGLVDRIGNLFDAMEGARELS